MGNKTHRRDMLRMGIAGLSTAQLLRLQQLSAYGDKKSPSKSPGDDVNCIFIFIVGGMPHQDMWDLKPNAPAEIRGDFKPISTPVPGLQLSDVIPQTAKAADKFAILRGMTHSDSGHGRGFHVMMTGKGAEKFAAQNGLELVDSNYFYTELTVIK